jgi:RND family efflux transporter MFP subunit
MHYRRILSGLVSLCGTLLIAAVVSAQGPPATLVETGTVTEHEFHDQVTLIGRTEAKVYSRIVAEISGRVTEINAAEGNRVRRGDPLITIDSSRIHLSLKAKEAEAEQASQQAFLARNNLKRAEELFQQKLVPESTIDSARAWAISTEARFDQLDAERGLLAIDLANCTVRAPYDGYTLRRQVDVGGWVAIGTPVYEMVDLASITVTVDLPEKHYASLAIGSRAEITISGNDQPYVGTVTGLARSAASETHTFPVLISVRNSDGKLGGGKLVRATLSLNEKFTSLAVDKDAIVRNSGKTMVYTIADGKAAPIMVETLSAEGRLVAVTGQGLQKDMAVVIRGNERIYPGAPVTTPEMQNGEQQASPSSENARTENNASGAES